MNLSPRTALTMRVLANRFHKGSPEALFHFLPEEEAEELRKNPISASEISVLLTHPEKQLSRIHYSWLIPIVQKVPKKAQSQLISAFSPSQATRLSTILNIPLPEIPLSPAAQRYLNSQILKNLPEISSLLPVSFLPSTPLSALLLLSKNDLVEIIRFTGIHDLAEELRQIVDTKRIKSIYDCLNPQEQQYLKYCMNLKEKFKALSLGLNKWAGDCEKLKATLQLRGLMRLGTALSGEHPDLIWHLTHLLDTGRGQALSKYYSKQAVPNITPVLAQQVIQLMGILKKKSRP